jgi:hypothetical protein
LRHFKKATDFITGQLYPTLGYSVPIYNFLLNKIDDEIDNNTMSEIKEAARAAGEKIKEYYPYTDGRIYVISTSKLNYN